MTVLNPVTVPKSIAHRANWATTVSASAFKGTSVLLSTFAQKRDNGNPLSLAKAYKLREPSAFTEEKSQ